MAASELPVRAVAARMFNMSTVDGCKRYLLRQPWVYNVACGALVEPPPSDVPEIIVTPKTKAISIPIPKSYEEAVTGPYRRYWIEAIRRICCPDKYGVRSQSPTAANPSRAVMSGR